MERQRQRQTETETDRNRDSDREKGGGGEERHIYNMSTILYVLCQQYCLEELNLSMSAEKLSVNFMGIGHSNGGLISFQSGYLSQQCCEKPRHS